MIYLLAGLTRISAANRGSAFLIPFFRNRSSNLFFAQDLDESCVIERFLPFNAFAYTIVDTRIPRLEKAPGDLGVLAFVRPGGAPVIGEVAQIIKALRHTQLSNDKSPFFEIDAYELTGQIDRLEGAVKRARHALGDGPIAARWSATEAKLLRQRRVNTSAIERPENDDIAELEADFTINDWPKRWLRLYSNPKNRKKLISIGISYIEHETTSIINKGSIIPAIIANRNSFSPRLISVAEEWLEQCLRIQPSHRSWPKVWRAIAANNNHLDRHFVDTGLQYLREAATSHRITNEWARIATSIRNQRALYPEIDEEIILLCRGLLENDEISGSSLRPAIKPLLTAPFAGSSVKIAERWLKRGPRHNNAWIDAFLSVLEVRGNDVELLEIGLNWLAQDPGNLRRWKQVYTAIDEHLGPSPTMLEVARDWLLRANRGMNVWPEVAMTALAQYNDPQVAAVASTWATDHPLHPNAEPLGSLLSQITRLTRP